MGEVTEALQKDCEKGLNGYIATIAESIASKAVAGKEKPVVGADGPDRGIGGVEAVEQTPSSRDLVKDIRAHRGRANEATSARGLVGE